MRDLLHALVIAGGSFAVVAVVAGGVVWYSDSVPAAVIVSTMPDDSEMNHVEQPEQTDEPLVAQEQEDNAVAVVERDTDAVSVPPESMHAVPEATRVEETSQNARTTSSLNSAEIEEILALHNAERRNVAIEPLQWSPLLAESAAGWADQLARKGCILEHSGGPYGENLYYSRKYGVRQTPREVEEIMTAFVDEKRLYNYEENSCRAGSICGHYTQIVWAGTTEVGCAKSICQSEDREEVWVCHYDPPGNVEGMFPY